MQNAPPVINLYLQKQAEIQSAKREYNDRLKELRELEKDVLSELSRLPTQQFVLNMSPDQVKVLGRNGVLREGTLKRKEYLSLVTLEKYLKDFMMEKFADNQSAESIAAFAYQAASAVWCKRVITETTVVQRTVQRKRKVDEANENPCSDVMSIVM
jgi:hypothetical protein